MSNLQKYLIHFGITILSIFITLTLTTTLYYFNILSPNTYNIIKLIAFLLVIFINAYFLGRKTKSKGYLEGVKLALLITIIFLLSALFTSSFTFKLILYYVIITITSVFGSMVGISKNKDN